MDSADVLVIYAVVHSVRLVLSVYMTAVSSSANIEEQNVVLDDG